MGEVKRVRGESDSIFGNSALRQRFEVPDRPSRRDRLGGGDDRVRVDTVMPVQLGERAGPAEMLDAERPRAMTGDGAVSTPFPCPELAVTRAVGPISQFYPRPSWALAMI